MPENVCNFIPYETDRYSLHTINFVLETNEQNYKGIITHSTYKAYFIASGKGILHLAGKKIELKFGDVFFTFPGVPFSIESVENFTFMYISFLGTRGNMIMENMGIESNNFYFPDCEEIFSFWQKGLDIKKEISDLICESILLYTFYYIGNRILVTEEKKNKSNDLALNVKKYIDDNYGNNELSLESMSKQLLYTPKYVSSIFKKTFGITVSEYITTLRIQHACTLIQQGFTSISDISNQCGYSDPQYFSKIFRKKMYMTPSQYIKSNR